LGGTSPDYRDIAGRYFEPDTTLLASVRYQVGEFGVNLQQRYIPESTLDGASLTGHPWIQWEPGLALSQPPKTGQFVIDDNTVASKSYTDLTLTYDGEMSGGQSWQASLSISNLFDEDPPIIAEYNSRFSSQTIAANNYDVYGRRYMLNFRYRF